MKDKSIIQSVEKVLVILKLFTKNEPMLTLHNIHQKTGFSKTTAMRFCNTLNSIGFLEKVYIGQLPYYRLGIELFTIGSMVIKTIDIPERTKKYLQDISNQLEDSSYLFIERNNKAYCIDAVKGSYFIQDATTNIGDVLPLNCGGAPLAILAHTEPGRQSEIINFLNLGNEEKLYLYNRLEVIKTNGYSFSNNEVNLNTAAIGVPIFNHEGMVVAAISVGGIDIRFSNERLPKILEVIKDAGNKLSRELGWSGL
jgi:IclR family KDG regulon transcriptional repressor